MWMIVLVVTITGIHLSNYVWLPFGIQPAMSAMIFMYAGHLIKKTNLFETGIKTCYVKISESITGKWKWETNFQIFGSRISCMENK